MNADDKKEPPCDCEGCQIARVISAEATKAVDTMCKQAVEVATECMDMTGIGMLKMCAFRSKANPKMAAFGFCFAGPMTDDDIRGLRDYLRGMHQDAMSGVRGSSTTVITDVDKLGPIGGGSPS